MARAYRLGKRAEKTAELRGRVLAAARELLLSSNIHEVSVDEVAARAGAGRTTIFLQFGSKAGLLRALEEEVSARAGIGPLLQELTQPDAAQALRAAFEVGARVWAAEHLAFRKLFALARVDPEMEAVMTAKEAVRRKLVASLVAALAKQGQLRPGCTPAKARDLLWLLTSFESFDALYAERKRPEAVAELLLEVAWAVAFKAPERTSRRSGPGPRPRPRRGSR